MSDREQYHSPGHPVVEREVNELFATINELDWDCAAEVDLESAETIAHDACEKQIHVRLDLYHEVDDV